MSNKLVIISGKPHWMTPEGRFLPAEMCNGRVVEHLYLKTPAGLFPVTESFIATPATVPGATETDTSIA